MRNLALILSLLLSIPSLAQTSLKEISSTTRRISNRTVPLSDFETQELQKKEELQRLILRYDSTNAASQQVIKGQIQTTLFTLFDLGITKKEVQAKTLKSQLASMKTDATYSDKNRELQSLQMALAEIENSLKFRRENRDRIVYRKLGQILD